MQINAMWHHLLQIRSISSNNCALCYVPFVLAYSCKVSDFQYNLAVISVDIFPKYLWWKIDQARRPFFSILKVLLNNQNWERNCLRPTDALKVFNSDLTGVSRTTKSPQSKTEPSVISSDQLLLKNSVYIDING